MHPAQATCLACAVKNLAPRLENTVTTHLFRFRCSGSTCILLFFGYNIRRTPAIVLRTCNSVSKGCTKHVVLLKRFHKFHEALIVKSIRSQVMIMIMMIMMKIYTRIFPLPRVLLREEQVFYNTTSKRPP